MDLFDIIAGRQGGSGGSMVVDQHYSPESQNAQSGIATAEALEKFKTTLPDQEIFFKRDNTLVTFNSTKNSNTATLTYEFKIYNTEYTRNQTEILTQKSYWNYPLPITAYVDVNNITQVKDAVDGNYDIVIILNDGLYQTYISIEEFKVLFQEFGATVHFRIISDNSNGKISLSFVFENNFPDKDTMEAIDSEVTAVFISTFEGIKVKYTQSNPLIAEVVE